MALSGHPFALAIVLGLQVGVPQRGGDSMSGLIVGQVVDADSGRPIAGAVVSLAGPPGARVGPIPRVLTGSSGHFVFRALRRGSYSITAFKAGFTTGAHGRTRPAGPAVPLPLADGQRTGEALIRMWRHASISGTVVDESGEHLVEIRVQAFRRAVVSGRRRYVPSGASATDDRGIYRIGSLMPGDYIVGAVARHATMPLSMAGATAGGVISASRRADEIGLARQSLSEMIPVGDAGYLVGGGEATPPPPRQGRLSIYPPTFHPAAPAGDAATVVPLRAGEEHVNADLQLAPVTTVSLSGHVVGPDGPVTMTALRLVASDTVEIALDADAMTTMTGRAGHFMFSAVPSGQYRLRLLRGQTPGVRPVGETPRAVIWADTPLSVGSEDITDLAVTALPGLRVSGRLEFEGDPPRWPRSVTSLQVVIEPADAAPGVPGALPYVIHPDRFGEFTSPGLPGGRYYVRIADSPAGWMFKSATGDGRDVADTPFSLVEDVANVVVTFTDRWSGVRGSVQNREGPDGMAAVIVFPTDSDTWGSSGLSPRRVRMVRPGKLGDYSLNLPPGEYYLIAVPDAQAADWQDPAFMELASRAATRVAIEEGARRTLDLRTRELR